MSIRERSAALALVSLSTLTACDAVKERIASRLAGDAAASTATDAGPSTPTERCLPAHEKGVAIALGDTERATLAAVGSEALLVVTETRANPVGGRDVLSYRGVLGTAFPAVKFEEAPAAYAGEGSGHVGAALAFRGKPMSVTFGNGGNGGFAESWRYTLAAAGERGGRKAKALHSADRVAAAGRTDLALAVTSGRELLGDDPNVTPNFEKGPGVRAAVFDEKLAFTSALHVGKKGEVVDAVAAAVSPTQAAAVFRAAGRLLVARVGPKAERLGDPLELAKGEVGSPAAVFHGETLHVVWAEAPQKGAPYTLRHAAWNPSQGKPEPKPFTTAGSSFSPSLAVHGARVLVAWMEGDAKTGRVRLSTLPSTLPVAAVELAKTEAAAVTVSADGAHARDPRLAASETSAWLVWSEFPKSGGEIRATPVACGSAAKTAPFAGAPPKLQPLSASRTPSKPKAATVACEGDNECEANERCDNKKCTARCPAGKVFVMNTCGAPCSDHPDMKKPCPKGFTCMLTNNVSGGCVKE